MHSSTTLLYPESSLLRPSDPRSASAAASSVASDKGVATLTASTEPTSTSRPPSISALSRHSHPVSTHSARNSRLSLAAIARDRTTNAWSNLAVRSRPSISSLHSVSSDHLPKATTTTSSIIVEPHGYQAGTNVAFLSPQRHFNFAKSPSSERVKTSEIAKPALNPTLAKITTDERHLLERSPSPSRSPSPTPQSYKGKPRNKMHQTSSRLLRMTDEERPFTRDFKDLFSTLMVSLPLTAHRVRFQKVDHTFTSEEAINNLGSLKFSQSNRMPDPKDPSRIVTTTTTTTFSMAKEMARSVCQRFMDARFIESADGKLIRDFPLKGAVWQLTPKGMNVLTRFCQRNGINQRHVLDVLDSTSNTMSLVILERDSLTDKLSHDRATVEVIFRRFVGQDGPNLKNNVSSSDSDSLSDYYNGLVGVKMAKERRIADRIVPNTFTGKAAVDWLMDCCTTVDRRETYEIAESFVTHSLIWAVSDDKIFAHQNPGAGKFQPTKNAVYALTERGQRVAGWISRESDRGGERSEPTSKPSSVRNEARTGPRDSNNNRLQVIVNDAALRLLFREYLRDTHCEENLSFYLEVREFTKNYDNAERDHAFQKLDAIRENLAAAYGESSDSKTMN